LKTFIQGSVGSLVFGDEVEVREEGRERRARGGKGR